jgi:hypothetical protein
MKKLLFTTSILLSFSSSLFAQDAAKPAEPKWKYAADAAGTGALAGISNYYKAGGNTTVTVLGKLNIMAHYKKEKVSWDNDFAGQLGTQRVGKIDDESVGFTKNVDFMNISSKLGYSLSKNTNATFYGLFNSQFMKGFNAKREVVSAFLAPAKMDFGVGLEWKPVIPIFESFSVMFSPLNGRLSIVAPLSALPDSSITKIRKDLGNVNNEAVRFELGALLALKYRMNILQMKDANGKVKDYPKMTYSSTLNAFMGYLNYKDKTTGLDAGKPFNPDITLWNHSVDFRVNKIITLNGGINILYDDDIRFPIFNNDGTPVYLPGTTTQKTGPRTQFNYTLGVGLAWGWSKSK